MTAERETFAELMNARSDAARMVANAARLDYDEVIAENKRLLEVIREAPHQVGCKSFTVVWNGERYEQTGNTEAYCNCWKQAWIEESDERQA